MMSIGIELLQRKVTAVRWSRTVIDGEVRIRCALAASQIPSPTAVSNRSNVIATKRSLLSGRQHDRLPPTTPLACEVMILLAILCNRLRIVTDCGIFRRNKTFWWFGEVECPGYPS